jgi:hypothetical protein
MLEVIVWGYERDVDAKSALERELERVVVQG